MSTQQSKNDHNALLLQVMAHDLLAPLTAIKWQIELLARQGISGAKREEYLKGLQQSAQLGITLTKHAHVAGRALTGSYVLDEQTQSVSGVVRDSILALVPQYARHGVVLTANFEEGELEMSFDAELIGVLVWSLAKFYLSATPPQSSVSVQGMRIAPEGAPPQYVVLYTAPDIPEVKTCVQAFVSNEAQGVYDQASVFARLTHVVADLLSVQVSVSEAGTGMLAEIIFTPKG
jgi:hypothetical protein